MSTPSKVYLFRRSNGIYYIQFVTRGHTYYKSTGCISKAEALQALASLGGPRAEEPLPQEPAKSRRQAGRPLCEFRDEFLAHAKATFRPKTAEIYEQTLRNFIALSGDLELRALTPRHLDRYKAARLQTVSPVTVNMELRGLKACLQTAVRWKLLETNPFKELQQATVPDQPPVCRSTFS